MSNSSLVTYTKISPHKTKGRKYPITKITIHHMAGALSVETCGNVFQTREASSNYGVDGKGHVGLYVDEADRSWASSNSDNDNRAVTIEVANDKVGGDWHVSDIALNKTIDLCVDICKRNGMPGLTWTGDRNGTLTIHKMFAATACPGPYLESKMAYIAEEVTRRVNTEAAPSKSVEPSPVVTPEQDSKSVEPATAFTVEVLIDDLFIRKNPSFNSGTNGFTGKGVFTIVETQNGFGLLKSYKDQRNGWIYLDNPNYVKKLSNIKEEEELELDYQVKVITSALNIRKGPGTKYNIAGVIRDRGVYTIVEQTGNWGLLKSYKDSQDGWICLDYTKKI